MKNYRLQLTDGVKDYMGDEMVLKNKINNLTINVLMDNGYELIQTPTFEYVDVFMVGKKGNQSPELYNLINNQGEILSLRSDMTASIGRVIGSHDNLVFPKKYCYLADTFRYPRRYQGKTHEFSQSGIEIIGLDNIKSDIEVLKMASIVLENLNITNYTIHIGNSNFLNTYLSSLNLNETNKNNIIEIIQSKDFVKLENYLNECNVGDKDIEFILKIMMKSGRLAFLNNILENNKNEEMNKIILGLIDLYNSLDKIGLSKKIVFDFSIFSYGSYYTGLIFQVFTDGLGKSLISGGRYNNFFKEFGRDLPAVGFGFDMNSALELVNKNSLIDYKKNKYIIYSDIIDKNIIEYSNMLKCSGYIVSDSLIDDYDETYNYALKNNFDYIIKYIKGIIEVVEVKR